MKKQLILSVIGLVLVTGSVYALSALGAFDGIVGSRLGASVMGAFSNTPKYNIRPSKTVPGAFTFDYQFEKVNRPKDEANFDLPIAQFDEKAACKELKKAVPGRPCDFGPIRDDKGYPLRENAFMNGANRAFSRKTSLNPFRAEKALASDDDPNTLGSVNCRANTNVTGYFKAYFEDIALDTNVDYDDLIHGPARRAEACQVLQDIAMLIKLDTTTVTPDILFMKNPGNLPAGAAAAASAYTGYYSVGPDNGSLHKHIISHQDPTPATGNFDAFIITNFNGINWSVDSTLNANTYDFYSVIYHEALHALGFRGLLPAVITSTGDAHTHGTFDKFTYKDGTLAQPFFADLTEFLNAPVGAPSSWFITNTAVYRGVKNIVGATPDGVRPVFSPGSWQQGSSLSHFDMTRSGGQTYVMHPSIGTNTTRSVHADEKEVLCHEGYMVLGMSGCEQPTPVAVNDQLTITGTSMCIQPLANDTAFSGGTLSLQDVIPVTLQTGDMLNYYASEDCTTGLQTSATNAKSIKINFGSSQDTRLIKYTNKDPLSNRISSFGRISISDCGAAPGEYVCNGDFEMTLLQQNSFNAAFDCNGDSPDVIPFWCGNATSDLVGYDGPTDISPLFNWMRLPHDCEHAVGYVSAALFPGCQIDTSNHEGRASFSFNDNNFFSEQLGHKSESIFTKLKINLLLGRQYKLSFDVHVVASHRLSFDPALITSTFVVAGLDSGVHLSPGQYANFSTLDQTLPHIIVPLSNIDMSNQWVHIEHDFMATGNHDFLRLYGDHIATESETKQFLSFYFDNISVTEVADVNNSVSGKIYYDLNSNGSFNSSEELGLNGVQVKLFQEGNSNPIQTTTTQNIPHLGEYSLSNLADGTYYVALGSESVYPAITQPATNGVLNGYNHAYQVTVSGGQTITDKNFGVVLETGDLCPNIRGIQTALPLGYELINGECIPTVEANIDLCPNIPGMQATVPAGYARFLNKCFRLINADTVTKFPKTPADPGIIDSSVKK